MNSESATPTTPTTQRSQQFQLLVNTIETTFKGNSKVNNILASLQSLFATFDDVSTTNVHINGCGGGKMAAMENGASQEEQLSNGALNFEREMMLGVITMLLNHLIKGFNIF